MADNEDKSGQLLASRYRLEQMLGSGGMGHVYRASNELIGRAVAIKLLRPEHAKNNEIVDRFLREARAANLVRHPNVVDVLDIGQDTDGSPFIVQELLKGEDLSKYALAKGGRLSPREVVELLCPVIDAIAEAHAKGVVHRDIKPENVFLASDKGRITPKLLDFGISQIKLGGVRTTQAGVVMGTPAYMPPEQIKGVRETDARSDVWAIGVMLFELLSGRLPFEGDDVPQIFVAVATQTAPKLGDVVSNAPVELSRIIEKCLQREPKDRYATAAEIARDLRGLRLDGVGLLTSSTSPSDENKNGPTAPAGPPPSFNLDLVVPEAPVPKPAAARAPTPKIALELDSGPGAYVSPSVRPRANSVPTVMSSVSSSPPRALAYDTLRASMPPPAATPATEQHHEESAIVALVAVVVVTLAGLAALTLLARSTDGWHLVANLNVVTSPELGFVAQVVLALGASVAGLFAMRGAFRIWTSEMGGKAIPAALVACVASGAFFLAFELLRAL